MHENQRTLTEDHLRQVGRSNFMFPPSDMSSNQTLAHNPEKIQMHTYFPTLEYRIKIRL